MKALLAIGAILASSMAPAAIEDPEIPALVYDTFGVHCGTPYNYTLVTGRDDMGYYGRGYQSTSCSTGGRGTRPRKYAVCADLRWNADGDVYESYIVWSASGASVPGSAVCFGSP